MSWRVADLISPTRFLALINVCSTGLGFAQGMIMMAGLGPSSLGVLAVIGGINATVLNFLDVRLTDVTSKLYYRQGDVDSENCRQKRAAILLVCLMGTLAIAMAMGLLGWLAALVLVSQFTDSPVLGWWLLAHACIQGASHLAVTVAFLQRFSGRFYLFGSVRFMIQLLAFALFVWIFRSHTEISGYYQATMASSVVSLLLMLAFTGYIWIRHDQLPLFSVNLRSAARAYIAEWRIVFYGNFLSYSKLLHRASDTLVVGWFADDRTTGLYKFVRAITDGLYVLFDAANQVYQPRFLELLASNDTKLYRNLARRLFLATASFVGIALITEAILLTPFLHFAFGDKFIGSERGVMVMTLPFLFVLGVYTWIWPVFIHTGMLKRFTIASMTAAVVQQVIVIILFRLTGPSILSATIGYLSYYLVMIPIAYHLVKTIAPHCVPTARRSLL